MAKETFRTNLRLASVQTERLFSLIAVLERERPCLETCFILAAFLLFFGTFNFSAVIELIDHD